jgi:hypothetical protein
MVFLDQCCRVEFIRPGVFHRQPSSGAGNRGYAIDVMVQEMTPPTQCVAGLGDFLVSNGNMAVGRMNSALHDRNCRVEFIRPGMFHRQPSSGAGNRGDAIDLMVQGMTPPLRNASQAMVASLSPMAIMAVGRMNSALQRLSARSI